MGTNVTHRSHSRCRPYPIPQPVEVDHTTGVYIPYSFRTVVWVSFTSHMNKLVKVLWDGTYGFSSLSEKTRKSNHLHMSLPRQHFPLSYLKTLSAGLVGVWASDFPLGTDRCCPNWANQAWSEIGGMTGNLCYYCVSAVRQTTLRKLLSNQWQTLTRTSREGGWMRYVNTNCKYI